MNLAFPCNGAEAEEGPRWTVPQRQGTDLPSSRLKSPSYARTNGILSHHYCPCCIKSWAANRDLILRRRKGPCLSERQHQCAIRERINTHTHTCTYWHRHTYTTYKHPTTYAQTLYHIPEISHTHIHTHHMIYYNTAILYHSQYIYIITTYTHSIYTHTHHTYT